MAKYITLDNLKVFLNSITAWVKEQKYTKKDELKTINGQSIVGSGNITINSETDLTNYFTDDSYYINKDGDVSFKNIDASGNLTSYGDLYVESNSTIMGDLSVQGTTTTGNLKVPGTTYIGDLGVGILNALGTTTMGNMTISADNDKNTTISADKIILETDNITLTATQTHIENTVYSEGGKIIGLDSVNGETTWEIDNTCGNAYFKNIEVDGDLTTYGNLNVELNSTLLGNLDVQGNVSCSNSLTVNGSLTVNNKNVVNAIDSLQASTFTHTDTDSVDHYRLTWFTSSGGGRNVDIPTYTGKKFNSIEDAMDPNIGGSFLADGGLIEDLLDYIDQYIDSKI